ncbi:MAG: helix-turn-helix domain-containing protein [Bacteroidota bacterium]|nr:helix-turn-helix domain-containing protein [Bacteroidota bacterium]
MFSLNYNNTDYTKLINEFGVKMNAKVKNDTLIIPEGIAEGYFKSITLSNGIQCLLSDYTLHQDMYLQRNHSNREFYIIRFDEISISDTLMVKIDNDYIWEGKQNRASVLLTSSLFDFAYMATEGTKQRSLNVLITRKWLAQYLNIESLDDVLKKYLSLKTGSYNFSPFDIEYRMLFNEVMEENHSVMRKSIIENRIMLMVEKFLQQLYQKLHQLTEIDKVKIHHDEIKRLMEVESYLVKDFSTPPPLSCLSKIAAMSATTLKNKFKKLYGSNLYEYFQKSRMQRAKVLIMSHKYSIKEIGSQLGYSNLSNFATAFKKEFNRLPSQLNLQ